MQERESVFAAALQNAQDAIGQAKTQENKAAAVDKDHTFISAKLPTDVYKRQHLHHLEPNVLPGEQLGHSAGNLLFIINNNQFIHLAAPIRVQGKTVLSACPYTGADYHLSLIHI